MEGLLVVELVPSPKLHFHEVGLLVLLSVNCTFNELFPEVGDAVNAATGFTGVVTFIYAVFVTLLLPAEFVAVRVTL